MSNFLTGMSGQLYTYMYMHVCCLRMYHIFGVFKHFFTGAGCILTCAENADCNPMQYCSTREKICRTFTRVKCRVSTDCGPQHYCINEKCDLLVKLHSRPPVEEGCGMYITRNREWVPLTRRVLDIFPTESASLIGANYGTRMFKHVW